MKQLFINALITLTFSTVCLAQKVVIEPKQIADNKIEIYIKNDTDQDQSVELDCELKGMTSSEKLPITKFLSAKSSTLFTTLTPKDIYKGFGYGTSIQYIEGNVMAKHDDSYVYYLPYPAGKGYKIDQGYLGKQTHTGTYALDFHMDIGTEITAIRGGKVTKVVDKFDRGCPDASCEQYNNLVLVTHEDGTIGDYSHLKKNGAKVKVGDVVKPGDLIGLSGDTGWASGPHLHLEIYIPAWSGKTSVKANYHLSKTSKGEPLVGETYTQQALR